MAPHNQDSHPTPKRTIGSALEAVYARNPDRWRFIGAFFFLAVFAGVAISREVNDITKADGVLFYAHVFGQALSAVMTMGNIVLLFARPGYAVTSTPAERDTSADD